MRLFMALSGNLVGEESDLKLKKIFLFRLRLTSSKRLFNFPLYSGLYSRFWAKTIVPSLSSISAFI